jgi:hypothetical protein
MGYPALLAERFKERVRTIDPRIEVVGMPVDPDTDWVTVPPDQPHDEPPPWAVGRADERKAALARTEVLIQLHTPKDLMRLAPNLRWLQGIGAGVDQFAVAGVTRDRVVVTNASGVSSGSMAEFVIGRLLQIWKRFPEAAEHQQRHEYVRTYGRSFAGSVVGVVGLGSIGRAVAEPPSQPTRSSHRRGCTRCSAAATPSSSRPRQHPRRTTCSTGKPSRP